MVFAEPWDSVLLSAAMKLRAAGLRRIRKYILVGEAEIHQSVLVGAESFQRDHTDHGQHSENHRVFQDPLYD